MSDPNNEIANTGGPASSSEPSMEEILASIRRILKDDQASTEPAEATQVEDEDDIFVLDATMIVKPAAEGLEDFEPVLAPESIPEIQEPAPVLSELAEPGPALVEAPEAFTEKPYEHLEPDIYLEVADPISQTSETVDLPPSETIDDEIVNFETNTATSDAWENTTMSNQTEHNVQPPQGLVGEEASNAAAGSIGALIRSISSDRSIAVGRPGLTLEDLVREELRPLLKSWLDSNLPPLVERIVRAEIQRVVERSIT